MREPRPVTGAGPRRLRIFRVMLHGRLQLRSGSELLRRNELRHVFRRLQVTANAFMGVMSQ